MFYAEYPAKDGTHLLTANEVRNRTGVSSSEQYRAINEGRHPPPVQTGARSVRTPDWVIDLYNEYRAAGKEWNTEIVFKEIGAQLIFKKIAARRITEPQK
jgi:predicted DNA-binding transcriptional regulator AlpA